MQLPSDAPPTWTFFSNHAHVLFYIADDPTARVRDIAAAVGITERAVQRILGELSAARVIQVRKTGRRNTYVIRRGAALRHPLEDHRTVGDLITLVSQRPAEKPPRRRRELFGIL